jgi:protocatechuate 3,4-dioxygenase beta subunit
MQRRAFMKETGLFAIGISVLGKVHWDNNHYLINTTTTTDILGPYYRPNAPFKTNINPKDYSGKLFHVYGAVLKEDGTTPFENCLVEIWQCDEHMQYDNTSDEYRYRGSQKTDNNGRYLFTGMHPIPYPSEGNPNVWRPAHFHLLFSGEGQQDLITQIYLEGDPYLEKDKASASPQAISRRMKIMANEKNEEAIRFDVVMAKEFVPNDFVFETLTGIYKMNDHSVMEFYRKEDLLMMKWNSQIREGLSYKGNNSFAGGITNQTTVKFQLQKNGEVQVNVHLKTINKGEFELSGVKAFKY